jgi:hypothetical protein
MDLHNDLFEGPPPQAGIAHVWPGYDPAPARPSRLGLLARLFVRRATA